MDSRDIKEEPGIIQGDKYLEEIYSMQKNLLAGYIGIEGLPQYPIDINTKASQSLLKDFTARVVEELSEGYESFQAISESMSKNHWKLANDNCEDSTYIELLNNLQNANEENADAIHFFVELLIYANVGPDDIMSYMEKYAKDNHFNKIEIDSFNEMRGDVLYTAQNMGVKWLMDEGNIDVTLNHQKIDLLKWYENKDSGSLPEYNINLLVGGRMYNYEDYEIQYPYILWKITHHLNIARNFLKNKPWKQSQVMTQELKYQAELVKAFIYFCGYLGWIGMDSKEVFYIYFKKNHINKFRQKSLY